MRSRALQLWLCSLSLHIASAGMREWAAAMVREIDEIENPRTALAWAAACLIACITDRLRPLLRPVVTAARLSLAACCLGIAGRMALQVVPGLAHGAPLTWTRGFWLVAAALFGAAAALVALRRGTAAWVAVAATAITVANFLVALSAVPFDLLTPEQLAMVSQERIAGSALIGVMSAATLASFWLTRRPAPPFVV